MARCVELGEKTPYRIEEGGVRVTIPETKKTLHAVVSAILRGREDLNASIIRAVKYENEER